MAKTENRKPGDADACVLFYLFLTCILIRRIPKSTNKQQTNKLEFLFRIKRGVMPEEVREAALDSMSTLGNHILNCDLPGWFYVLWTTPLLFAPWKDKATRDARPVACGNARRRFHGRWHGLNHVAAIKLMLL